MVLAATLRRQIEAALERRIPAALTPAAKVRNAVQATGIGALDDLTLGGLPEGAISELVGPECSGRTAVALSFVARMTRAGKVCAWVDVTDSLDPVSAAAAGVDLRRMLWVRCGVVGEAARQRRFESGRFKFRVPEQYFVPPVVKKGLHGGGFGGHPRGEARGMAGAVGALRAGEAVADGKSNGNGNSNDKGNDNGNDNDKRRSPTGMTKRKATAEAKASATAEAKTSATTEAKARATAKAKAGAGAGVGVGATRFARPWGRMEQAMRAADLLLQAGGFGAGVIDMGGLAPEFVSRVPLATWFRYRAAAERTRASVVLLTQVACAKSSAEVVLRMEAEEILAEPTVFAGLRPRATCGGAGRGARRRHEADCEASEFRSSNVVSIRKPPQPLHGADALRAIGWESRTVVSGTVRE